jgi:hypothetical protein
MISRLAVHMSIVKDNITGCAELNRVLSSEAIAERTCRCKVLYDETARFVATSPYEGPVFHESINEVPDAVRHVPWG